MKLTKISLAALVALGAFSSVASATPLEEAIKNVDLSGFARYRYENENNKDADGSHASAAKHNFKLITNFKAAIDDNFFGVIGFRYNKSDDSGNRNGATDVTNTNTSGNFDIHQFYLGYTYGGTTVTAGKQVVGSFFTDDTIGTGLKVVNTDVQGLTVTAFGFDALEQSSENDGGLLTKGIVATARDGNYAATPAFNAGNFYGLGLAGTYNPIGFQLWYNSLENVVDLIAAEVSASVDVSNDVNISFKGQFVDGDADGKAKKGLITTPAEITPPVAAKYDYNDAKFYAAELSGEFFNARLAAGYIGYKVDNKGVGSVSIEDQGSLIDVGEQRTDEVLDYTALKGKGNFWFARAGYTFDKFDFDVDYIDGKVKYADSADNLKYKEIMPQIAYNYSKKLKFSTFYSYAKYKDDETNKSSKYRFEAKYSF